MNKRSRTDIFIIGFALFSMFFGAGNVIFPPYLGVSSGADWLMGFMCYYLADIGLALLALFSMFRKGSAEGIVNPIGKIPSTILMCAITLCIGPMLAIPRTAATTFEMSVAPLAGSVSAGVFSVVFFLLIFLLTVRQTSVVDIVGKFLTPALLAGLLILIIKGVFTPLGEIAVEPLVDNLAGVGIKAGYQTMDVLATMLFGVLILQSTESKGYTEPRQKRSVAFCASIVAGAILLVVYGGLTYLGATVSQMYDLSISRSALVLAIVQGLLGEAGIIIFAIVVALACVTTAVGLVSSCANYFSTLSNGKLKYPVLVGVICLFSAIVSNVGLEQLVAIAAPVLDIVYPPTLVLIALSFFKTLPLPVYRMATLGSLIFSVLTTICTYTGLSIPFLDALPFASLGFGWIVPSILFGLVGMVMKPLSRKSGSTQPN